MPPLSRNDAETLRHAIQFLLIYARNRPASKVEKQELETAWKTLESLTASPIPVPGEDAAAWTYRLRMAGWKVLTKKQTLEDAKTLQECQDALHILPIADSDGRCGADRQGGGSTEQTRAGAKQKLKPPPNDAIKCYRLSIATGKGQCELAEMLSRELHRSIGQPTVSRWLKQVRAWLTAGNVLPDLSADNAKPKIVSMDPAAIDRGDGRKKATRPRRSEDADGDDELQKLLAEQQAEDDYESDPIQDKD